MAGIASVCVGISRYRFNASPLEFAEREAANVHCELVARGSAGTLLTGAKATRQGVLLAFEQAHADTHRGDLLVFYFTGHGGQAANSEDFEEYLMFADGPFCDSDLGALLHALSERRILLVLDACHSGGLGDSLSSAGIGAGQDEPLWVQLFASASPGEFSRGVVGGGSDMTNAFLETLRRSPLPMTYEDFFATMLGEMRTTSHPVHRAWEPAARQVPFDLGAEPVFLRAG